MSDGMLLPASSNREKPIIHYSLNDKSTELLDNTAIDEPRNQAESEENTVKQDRWRKSLKCIISILKIASLG